MERANDLRQLPLFPQPQRPEEIHQGTALKHTIEFFIAHLQAEGKSENTQKSFRSDLKLLAEYHGENVSIGTLSTRDLDAFMRWIEVGRGVPCSRKTYARRVTTLKVYFKWLHELGALPHDPAEAVLQRSGQAPLSHALDDDQVRAVLYASRQIRLRRRNDEIDTRPEMLLRLILDTGIKKGEAMRLTRDDVQRTDPDAPVLVVKGKVRNVFKERSIPLDPGWLPVLDRYLAQYQIADTLFTCTARNLEYILSDIGQAADLPFKLSFEVLRWSSAVQDHRRGIDDDTIRKKLGLSEISWQETGSKIRRLATLIDGDGLPSETNAEE